MSAYRTPRNRGSLSVARYRRAFDRAASSHADDDVTRAPGARIRESNPRDADFRRSRSLDPPSPRFLRTHGQSRIEPGVPSVDPAARVPRRDAAASRRQRRFAGRKLRAADVVGAETEIVPCVCVCARAWSRPLFAIVGRVKRRTRRELCPLTPRKDRSRALETADSRYSFHRGQERVGEELREINPRPRCPARLPRVLASAPDVCACNRTKTIRCN